MADLLATATIAYQRDHAELLARLAAAVSSAWLAAGGWDRADVPALLAALEPIVTTAQLTAAAQVDGYVATVASAAPIGITAAEVTDLRAGASFADVYERSLLQAWRRIGEGMARDQAFAAARARAIKTAQTDVQLAQSHAMAKVTRLQDGVVGYRRVLTGRSCRFCATASTQRYKIGRLMPLHSGCDCGVAPIIGQRDPGHVINQKLLATLKERGPDYWKRSGFVDNDGNPIDPTDLPSSLGREGHDDELGPVLAAA